MDWWKSNEMRNLDPLCRSLCWILTTIIRRPPLISLVSCHLLADSIWKTFLRLFLICSVIILRTAFPHHSWARDLTWFPGTDAKNLRQLSNLKKHKHLQFASLGFPRLNFSSRFTVHKIIMDHFGANRVILNLLFLPLTR